MFKKVEIWILYLLTLSNILISICFGVLVRQELVGTKKLGWVSKTALFLSEIPTNLKSILSNNSPLELNKKKFPNLEGFNGETVIDQKYLLLSRYSGELKEGIVELVNLTNFKVLHTWNPDIDQFNKLVKKTEEFKFLNRDSNNSRQILMHPQLTNDGGLLFTGTTPLRKIDACSNLIFQKESDQFHHSLEIDDKNNIWTTTYLYPQSLPKRKVGRKSIFSEGFMDDAIVQLSPNGEILFEKSVAQIFIDNGLEYLLFAVGAVNGFNYAPIHINDVQPVGFDSNYWKKGDLFLSLRAQSMIVLYRPSTNKIIWKGTGPFFHQHDVNILDNKSISVFNNNYKIFADNDIVDGNSEVIIYDFKSNKYKPYLNDSLVKYGVNSKTQGRSKILSNGDLFIEEQNHGRILYFNKDGSLRWTYVNRAKDNKIYALGWSRILSSQKDIKTVKDFLSSRGQCND